MKKLDQLFSGNLYTECEHILSSVCNVDVDFSFTPIPDRATAFNLFNPCKMVKRDQEGREKSTRGYVWLDTDSVAILFNKFRIRSCHTLDNTEHNYYTGNFTHLYNPYMACLFAGKDYRSTRDAKSPVTGNTARYSDGTTVEHREHNAVANVYLMRDIDNKPYLFLSRLYQSTAENPWDASILRYVYNRCKRFGLGLALGDTWQTWQVSSDTKEYISNAYPEYRYKSFRTPTYTLPSKDKDFEAYGDDDIDYKESKKQHWLEVSGYAILEPTKDFAFPNANFDTYGYGSDHIELGDNNRSTCYECGNRVDEEDERYSDITQCSYCENCYYEIHASCRECGTDILRNGARENDRGYTFCEDCYNEKYVACYECDDEVSRNDATEIDDEYYCSTCAEELKTKTCEACNEKTDCTTEVTSEETKETIEVCMECEQTTVVCQNCERSYLPTTQTIGRGIYAITTITSGQYDQYTKRYTCNACVCEPVWIYPTDQLLQPTLAFA